MTIGKKKEIEKKMHSKFFLSEALNKENNSLNDIWYENMFSYSDQVLRDFNYVIDVAEWRAFKLLQTMAVINVKFNFLPKLLKSIFPRKTHFIFHETFQ